MFEREFEFTVQQPLDICDERVLNLNKSGCIRQLFWPISADIIQYDDYTKFYAFQKFGRSVGFVRVEAFIEPINEVECAVSGIAEIRGIVPSLVLIIVALVMMIVIAVTHQDWIFLIIIVPAFIVTGLQYLYYRNRLIRTIQKALTR